MGTSQFGLFRPDLSLVVLPVLLRFLGRFAEDMQRNSRMGSKDSQVFLREERAPPNLGISTTVYRKKNFYRYSHNTPFSRAYAWTLVIL